MWYNAQSHTPVMLRELILKVRTGRKKETIEIRAYYTRLKLHGDCFVKDPMPVDEEGQGIPEVITDKIVKWKYVDDKYNR